MTYYETWDEMDPRTNELTTATDAPPGVVLVRVEEYDRLRELLAAVKASQFEGIYCDDVNGVNWFDARDEALQEAGDE